MSEILSQDEINALMAAFAGGGRQSDRRTESRRATRQVKIYDFARPDKFSKDQLRALQLIHGKFARRLGTSLTSLLRSSVWVELVSIDQGTHEDYSKSIPNPSVVAVVDLAPLPGKAIMEMNPSVAFAIIDRVTGGRGEPGARPRELTDIEKVLLTKTFQSALRDYSDSWTDIVELDPQVESVTSTMLFTQVATPTDMVMVASCEVRMSAALGMLSICLPVGVLEPVLDKLSTEQCMGGARRNKSDHFSATVSKGLSKVSVRCSAVLGGAAVTVRDLVSLSVGDIVRLNSTPQTDLTFAVGDHAKFICRPGLIGNKMAVQIIQVKDETAGTEAA